MTSIIEAKPIPAKRADWMTFKDPDTPVIDVALSSAFLSQTRQHPQWQILRETFEDVNSQIVHPKFVLITGPSGSGKDVVSDSVFADCALNKIDVVNISIDSYYGPGGKDHYYNDYDHPNSIDYDLLVYHLNQLKTGNSINVPSYDFCHHRRSEKYTKVDPAPVVFISGIMIGPIVELFTPDLTVLVDAPLEVCKSRRFKRDVEQRGRTEEMCKAQWRDTVLPGFNTFVEPIGRLIRKNDPKFGVSIVVDNSCDQEGEICLETKPIVAEIKKQLGI